MHFCGQPYLPSQYHPRSCWQAISKWWTTPTGFSITCKENCLQGLSAVPVLASANVFIACVTHGTAPATHWLAHTSTFITEPLECMSGVSTVFSTYLSYFRFSTRDDRLRTEMANRLVRRSPPPAKPAVNGLMDLQAAIKQVGCVHAGAEYGPDVFWQHSATGPPMLMILKQSTTERLPNGTPWVKPIFVPANPTPTAMPALSVPQETLAITQPAEVTVCPSRGSGQALSQIPPELVWSVNWGKSKNGMMGEWNFDQWAKSVDSGYEQGSFKRPPPCTEALSMNPFIEDEGILPPFFTVWVPRDELYPRRQGTKKRFPENAKPQFPEDYELFVTGQYLDASWCTKIKNAVCDIKCYHSMSRLYKAYDPDEAIVCLGINDTPLPYRELSKSGQFPHPKTFSWLVNTDQETLDQLLYKDEMVSVQKHLQDLIVIQWDLDQARLGLKTTKWDIDTTPEAYGVSLSVDNKRRRYGYDRYVSADIDVFTVRTTGACHTTTETSKGGSSSLCWRFVGGKWKLQHIHHGGIEGQKGFRNRATSGPVVKQAIQKFFNVDWKPQISQAFEEVYNPLADRVMELLSLEEEHGCEFVDYILANQKDGDKLIQYFEDDEVYENMAVSEGIMSRTQWQQCIKKIQRRHKGMSAKHSKRLLYAATSARVAYYDPEAAEEARFMTELMDDYEHWLTEIRNEQYYTSPNMDSPLLTGFGEFWHASRLLDAREKAEAPGAASPSMVRPQLIHDALHEDGKPVMRRSLAIAKLCALRTKGQVTPTLTDLLFQGLVVHHPGPGGNKGTAWSLAPGTEDRWKEILAKWSNQGEFCPKTNTVESLSVAKQEPASSNENNLTERAEAPGLAPVEWSQFLTQPLSVQSHAQIAASSSASGHAPRRRSSELFECPTTTMQSQAPGLSNSYNLRDEDLSSESSVQTDLSDGELYENERRLAVSQYDALAASVAPHNLEGAIFSYAQIATEYPSEARFLRPSQPSVEPLDLEAQEAEIGPWLREAIRYAARSPVSTWSTMFPHVAPEDANTVQVAAYLLELQRIARARNPLREQDGAEVPVPDDDDDDGETLQQQRLRAAGYEPGDFDAYYGEYGLPPSDAEWDDQAFSDIASTASTSDPDPVGDMIDHPTNPSFERFQAMLNTEPDVWDFDPTDDLDEYSFGWHDASTEKPWTYHVVDTEEGRELHEGPPPCQDKAVQCDFPSTPMPTRPPPGPPFVRTEPIQALDDPTCLIFNIHWQSHSPPLSRSGPIFFGSSEDSGPGRGEFDPLLILPDNPVARAATMWRSFDEPLPKGHFAPRFYPFSGKPANEASLPFGVPGRSIYEWPSDQPFPVQHLPRLESYLERTKDCLPMPAASENSKAYFAYYLRTLLAFRLDAESPPTQGTEYYEMTMEQFGHILSCIAGCLDGHVRDTEYFKMFIGHECILDFKSEYTRQTQDPVSQEHAAFMGLTPAPVNNSSKPWYYHPQKDGWFAEWEDVCWNEQEGRATGACPASGAVYLRRSFNAQMSAKRERSIDYSFKHLQEFSTGLPSPVWDGERKLKDFLKEILAGVNDSKGLAWNKFSCRHGEANKGDWLANKDNILGVIFRVMLLVATDHALLARTSPRDMFLSGLLVPEELFGKNEIHLNKKVDSHRLRCIWNSAVSAELVMRFFHHTQNKLEIDLYQAAQTHSDAFPFFGACSGMGHHDEGNKDLCANIRNLLGGERREHNGASMDAKSWDLTVSRALWMCDAWRRADAARYGFAPYGWCYGLMNLGLVASAHIIVIGMEVHEVTWFGIMPSGIPSTSASNSFMRAFLHSEAYWQLYGRIALSLTMGDDTHARDVVTPEVREVWRKLGALIEAEDGRIIGLGEKVSFTSHLYDLTDDTVTFDNGPKLLLRLAYHGHSKLTAEQATGVRFAVRHTPGLRERVDAFVAATNSSWLNIPLDDDSAMDFAGF